MNKICLIAPYKDFIFLDNEEKVITKKYANLSEVLPLANEFKKEGGEIVITRGGSAKILRENTDLQIVEIEISSYEIIKTLQQIKDKRQPLGIVGYKNAVYKCSYLAKILGFIETYEVIYDEEKNYNTYIKDLESLIYIKKVTNFIGDTVLLNTLEKHTYYINFFLIKSEYNSIYRAYQKAKIFLEYKEKASYQNLYLTLALDNVDCGIVLTNNLGEIKEINSIAKKLYISKQDKTIFELFPELITLIAQNKKELILKINVENIIVTVSKIKKDELYLFIFRKALNIEKLFKNSKEIINNTNYKWKDIITKNLKFKEILELVKVYSHTDETILIYGESGTGKEMIAQSIHNESDRKEQNFIAFNCANFSETLIESELFGYEEGAFTGANKRGKKGLFEIANNGTIFLDEISEIPYHLQGKFLRVLEEKKIRKVGGEEEIAVNVRVIAASNRNLKKMVAEEKFREDLYYRLNVFEIETIPLRRRKEDIPYLSNFFLINELKDNLEYKVEDFENLVEELKKFDFLGNVRELKNTIKKVVTLKTKLNYSDNKIIKELSYNSENRESIFDKNMSLKEIEKEIVYKILEEEGGNKSRTAIRLKIDRGKIDRLLNR